MGTRSTRDAIIDRQKLTFIKVTFNSTTQVALDSAMSPHLFAIVCTADFGADRLNAFFDMTYRNSKEQDCPPSLLLVHHPSWTDIENNKEPTLATSGDVPGVIASLEQIAQSLKAATQRCLQPTLDSHLFAVLDHRSIAQDDGLVVYAKDDTVDSVRVHFDTVNSELIRIHMITGNLEHSKILAREQPDGVLRSKPRKQSERGGPAPRKRLGGQAGVDGPEDGGSGQG